MKYRLGSRDTDDESAISDSTSFKLKEILLLIVVVTLASVGVLLKENAITIMVS